MYIQVKLQVGFIKLHCCHITCLAVRLTTAVPSFSIFQSISTQNFTVINDNNRNHYLTEQYQTITPSKSCVTASLASFTMLVELAEPLQPINILSLGTSTLDLRKSQQFLLKIN